MTTLFAPFGKHSQGILRVVALVAVLVTVLYISTVQPSGNDFWLQAKIGELIWDTRTIPRTLVFPFTEVADQNFNAHEWLISIGFYWLVRIVGVDGLTYVLAFLGVLYFLLAVRLGYERSHGNMTVGLVCGVAALVTENYRHVIRPELVTMLLMVVFWILLERIRRKPSLLAVSVALALVVVWVNSHGSFILAPLMVGLYAGGAYIDQLRRHRALVRPSAEALWFCCIGALALVACLINPFGLEMLKFVLNFGNDKQASAHITEWLPTLSERFLHLPTFWAFGLIWGVTLITLVLHRKTVSARDWLIFAFFSYLAIKAIRFPVYLGLVCAYIIAPCIRASLSTLRRQNWAYVGLMLLSCATLYAALNYKNLQGTSPESLSPLKLSDAMVAALRDERHHGNVLNQMEFGAELIYWAYPRMRPASDARVDSYGFEYLSYQTALFSNDTLLNEFVQRYDVRYILMDTKRFNILFVKTDAWLKNQWEPVLMDSRAVFLRRSDVHY